jgi:hypothetical protein
MRVELKNIKTNARASRETFHFSATVYVDGKRVSTVENDGRGGPDWWSDWGAQARVNAYAATLPPIPASPDFPHDLPMNAEILICNLINAYLDKKQGRTSCAS